MHPSHGKLSDPTVFVSFVGFVCSFVCFVGISERSSLRGAPSLAAPPCAPLPQPACGCHAAAVGLKWLEGTLVPEFGSFPHLCCPRLASSTVACLPPLPPHLLWWQSLCLPQCFTLLCESLDAACPSASAPFYASLREEHQPLLDRLLQGSTSEQHALQGSTGGSSPSPPGAS